MRRASCAQLDTQVSNNVGQFLQLDLKRPMYQVWTHLAHSTQAFADSYHTPSLHGVEKLSPLIRNHSNILDKCHSRLTVRQRTTSSPQHGFRGPARDNCTSLLIFCVLQPGSDMAKAEKLWAKKQKKLAAHEAHIKHLQQMQLRRQQRAAARRGERMPKKVSFCCVYCG